MAQAYCPNEYCEMHNSSFLVNDVEFRKGDGLQECSRCHSKLTLTKPDPSIHLHKQFELTQDYVTPDVTIKKGKSDNIKNWKEVLKSDLNELELSREIRLGKYKNWFKEK